MVYFDELEVLRGVSLRMNEGERVAVVGPNSAGKTTLLGAISGLLAYRAKKESRRGGENITILGRIVFNGVEVSRYMPWQRSKMGIALCPERRRIFSELTVEENLKVAGHMLPRGKVRERLELVYSIFPELKNLRNVVAGFLSGGEQQMLAIGRGLMLEAKLLLIDEPFLGLSLSLRKRLGNKIDFICKELGLSLLVTEQNLLMVKDFCDRGYILEKGSIVAEGTIEELLSHLAP